MVAGGVQGGGTQTQEGKAWGGVRRPLDLRISDLLDLFELQKCRLIWFAEGPRVRALVGRGVGGALGRRGGVKSVEKKKKKNQPTTHLNLKGNLKLLSRQ